MAESSRQHPPDPVVLRQLVLICALLFGTVVDLAWPLPPLEPAAITSSLRPWPLRPGAHLASVGCIRPDAALQSDWRQVVGVSRKAAMALVARCKGQASRAHGSSSRGCDVQTDYQALKGVGERTSGRLRAAICR